MLFSCPKYVILERPSCKLPSALSKNCVSIFIYFCINTCFCIKQASKICTLLSSHLLALIAFSVQCFCFTNLKNLKKIVWNSARTTGNPVYPHGESSYSVKWSIASSAGMSSKLEPVIWLRVLVTLAYVKGRTDGRTYVRTFMTSWL